MADLSHRARVEKLLEELMIARQLDIAEAIKHALMTGGNVDFPIDWGEGPQGNRNLKAHRFRNG